MALIKCKDCGHDMSDKASACPYCGCPYDNFPEELRTLIESHIVKEDSEAMMNRLLKEAEEKLRNPGGLPYFYPGW